jgi:tRNA A37 threonylcarbamoyladenosine synthetase subunit TsaC/SUA5/YrdC
VVAFNLKDKTYMAIYDPKERNIIALWIIIGQTTYPIRNFTLSFANSSKDEISLFWNDPITFLLQKDPFTIKKLQLQ